MARYTVRLDYDVGPGSRPRGAGVLAAIALPESAVHRLSSCDGETLTLVVDVRSSRPASVCRVVAAAARTAWTEASGADPGEPTCVRVRPRRPPQPVPGGASRPREYAWRPDAGGDGRLVLLDPGSDPYSGPNGPGEQRDEAPQHVHAGSAPRRPTPGLGPLRIALPSLPRRRRDRGTN